MLSKTEVVLTRSLCSSALKIFDIAHTIDLEEVSQKENASSIERSDLLFLLSFILKVMRSSSLISTWSLLSEPRT